VYTRQLGIDKVEEFVLFKNRCVGEMADPDEGRCERLSARRVFSHCFEAVAHEVAYCRISREQLQQKRNWVDGSECLLFPFHSRLQPKRAIELQKQIDIPPSPPIDKLRCSSLYETVINNMLAPFDTIVFFTLRSSYTAIPILLRSASRSALSFSHSVRSSFSVLSHFDENRSTVGTIWPCARTQLSEPLQREPRSEVERGIYFPMSQ